MTPAEKKAKHAAYMREYRKAKGESLAAWQKSYFAEYRAENIDKIRAQQSEYRARKKEHISAVKKVYTQRNKEKKAAYDIVRRAKLRDHQSEYMKLWKKNFPEKKSACDRNRRAQKRQAEGKHTGIEIKLLFSQQRGLCVYCAKDLTGDYHADHIVPLSRGGTNWIRNIQLLCPKCNMRKHDKMPDEFERLYREVYAGIDAEQI